MNDWKVHSASTEPESQRPFWSKETEIENDNKRSVITIYHLNIQLTSRTGRSVGFAGGGWRGGGGKSSPKLGNAVLTILLLLA